MPNDQGHITVEELRKRVAPGYNMVAIVDPDYDVKNLDIFRTEGIPVLSECKGPLGCLRSLEHPGRRPGTLETLANDGQDHKLLHLQFHPGGLALLSIYTFRVESK